MAGFPKKVYLDYNSTSPPIEDVHKTLAGQNLFFGNPSSVHSVGRDARSKISSCRRSLAGFLNVNEENVFFTSGATEANAIILNGVISNGIVSDLLCSSIEHPSVLDNIPSKNHIKVLSNGQIDLDHLEHLLRQSDSRVLVSLMFANNETGIIQPIKETVDLVHKYNGLFFTDAVQAFGKIPFDINSLELDFVSISGHKFGGPQGVGALVSREIVDFSPLYNGGGQERFKRAGTENTLAILGLKIALDKLPKHYNSTKINKLRNKFEERLLHLRPDAVIFGHGIERLPNTTCVALPGILSETQVIRLDLEGYAVSAGSACSSGKISASHVLLSMGIDAKIAKCAIRISIGPETRWEELEGFLKIWSKF